MRSSGLLRRRSIALVLVALVVLGTLPGLAAAETRSGGTVVVGAGETVDGLTAFGGTIVVRGTVDGDLEAFGGDVLVTGEVTGSVQAFAGNVRIAGTVGRDVSVAAGNLVIQPGAEIGGSLDAAAGTVLVAGAIAGDVAVAGGTVTLAESAVIDGDVEYDVGDEGSFADEGATVGGTITRNAELGAGPVDVPSAPAWLFDVYGVLVNLALGAVLLVVFPAFSARVSARVADDPLRTGGVGLLTLVAVPVLLVVLAITIVGIPLSIIGAVLFGFVAWAAAVYGRLAVGTWAVSLADVESPWVGLLAGVLGVAILKLIPVLGGLVELVVFLLGLGALSSIAYAAYRRRRGAGAPADAAADPADAEESGAAPN